MDADIDGAILIAEFGQGQEYFREALASDSLERLVAVPRKRRFGLR